MNKYEEILKKENLKPKYEMKVITIYQDSIIIHSKLEFTSLTDFHFFLLSDHYDKIVTSTDDRIIVVNLETDETFSNLEKIREVNINKFNRG